MIARDPEFPYKILWSDEAKFHLNGAVNRHNCRYWHVEAPETTSEKTAVTVGVTIWCGIFPNGNAVQPTLSGTDTLNE